MECMDKKKKHTYKGQAYGDKLEQESKFAQGKDKSLFAL